MSEFTDRLRSFSYAYPTDVFGPVTDDERKAHASLITRNSAAMGRHCATFMAQAADEIERMERDVERYRWLRSVWPRSIMQDMLGGDFHAEGDPGANMDRLIDAQLEQSENSNRDETP